uniref:Uncharacterized protein n=1 Tax=Romanomermis culicivorax TaxID=13658 RepID=A0A915KST3_ROMCU
MLKAIVEGFKEFYPYGRDCNLHQQLLYDREQKKVQSGVRSNTYEGLKYREFATFNEAARAAKHTESQIFRDDANKVATTRTTAQRKIEWPGPGMPNTMARTNGKMKMKRPMKLMIECCWAAMVQNWPTAKKLLIKMERFWAAEEKAASWNGENLFTDLGNVGGCIANDGHCTDSDGTIIWDEAQFQIVCPVVFKDYPPDDYYDHPQPRYEMPRTSHREEDSCIETIVDNMHPLIIDGAATNKLHSPGKRVWIRCLQP